ncbi:flagellar hook-length control protein FliK [Zooshikella marina]|uniref:flagellar hook-length control protein FliK n=1 Tax=Zooshikella ganghwensis TaxID=202772 RepID=UPI001BAF33C7|nr:flagellar hook-length control protein FliK [Zooshikella ganghwensis]MBU2706877.1 flagellar hook-length control protein FliK [Zooshikella ganghwensis]
MIDAGSPVDPPTPRPISNISATAKLQLNEEQIAQLRTLLATQTAASSPSTISARVLASIPLFQSSSLTDPDTLPSIPRGAIPISEPANYLITLEVAGKPFKLTSAFNYLPGHILGLILKAPGQQPVKVVQDELFQQLVQSLQTSQNTALTAKVIATTTKESWVANHSLPLGQGGRYYSLIQLANQQQLWLNSEQPLKLYSQLLLQYREGRIHTQLTALGPWYQALLSNNLQTALRTSMPLTQAYYYLQQSKVDLPQAKAATSFAQLPTTVQQAINQLLQRLPSAAQLQQPEQLTQWLQQSGLFMEQKLLNTPLSQYSSYLPLLSPSLSHDLKALLLRTAQQLVNHYPHLASNLLSASSMLSHSSPYQPTLAYLLPWLPPRKEFNTFNIDQLFKMLQGALLRIHSSQLMSLHQQHTVGQDPTLLNSWNFELPIYHNQQLDHAHIHLEQREQQGKNGTKTPKWDLFLALDIDPIGTLYVQLTLLERKLSATFWAEHSQVLNKLTAQLDDFKKRLMKQGIEVQALNVAPGVPPQQKISIQHQLVDITT